MKQRIPEIDVLRGLEIFFVLLEHAIIVYPINLHSIPEYYGSNVPLFRRNGYRQSGVMIP